MGSQLNRFNWLAKHYDQLAKVFFGKSLYNAQIIFLPEICDSADVLILGGGTGKAIRELLKVNSCCRIWYVEASSAMIDLAEKNIEERERHRVFFIHGTEESLPPQVKFDAVITHFFLDLFSDQSLSVVIEKIRSSLSKEALWLACDFVDNGMWWQKKLLTVMYIFFRSTCAIEATRLPLWKLHMMQKGMRLEKSRSFFAHFIESTVFKVFI